MATPTITSPPSITSSIATSSASCITATPGVHGYVPPDACNAQWAYSPSFSAAIAFSVLFAMLTLSHVVLAFTFRKPFCWVIIMASAWETAAFVLRSLGAHNQQSGTFSVASQLFFLLAPLWINAFVYMAAGRLIWTYHPEKKVWAFKAISLGKWFVWLDIFSFIVQAAGGTMLNPGNSAKTMDLGKKVYMTGVGVQQLFILLFFALIIKFQLDVQRFQDYNKGRAWWKYVTYALYAVLLLITMRIIFRLAEFSGGMDPAKNKIPFQEKYALSLDAFPMVLAILILAVIHPGHALKGPESEFPSRKQRKADKKAKKAEKKRAKEAKSGGYEFEPVTSYPTPGRGRDDMFVSEQQHGVARF